MQCSSRVFWRVASAGETVALVAHDGVDALLDVAQHLGGRGSSATAGGNSPAFARDIGHKALCPMSTTQSFEAFCGSSERSKPGCSS